jgi:hypothetical protein
MKIADLTIEDFIIDNKVIEQQIVIDKTINMKFYSTYDEVMEDLDLLRVIGHSNSQLREDNGFPIFKNKKGIFHRMVSASTNIAVAGRCGPGNLYLVGTEVWKIIVELGYEYIDDFATRLCEKLEPYEVLCCRLFPKDWINPKAKIFDKNYKVIDSDNEYFFKPYYQFSGFTARLETHILADKRDATINDILDIEEIIIKETFKDKIKKILGIK